MHEFLRSIGFSSVRTAKDLDKLINWVTEKPDSLNIVSTGGESNLAQAKREVSGHAGISVVGEIDEAGRIIPEYYFPYITSTHVSSEAQISCEKQSERDGFIGMLEDMRMGMALIFSASNVSELMKRTMQDPINDFYHKCLLSALASDGTVLLGQDIPEPALKHAREEHENRMRLIREAHEGDPMAMETIARNDIREYHNVMRRLQETDIYTVVKSFFMPYGIETERYYFMGTILACQLVTNEYTDELFYRILVETNDMQMIVAINSQDLYGIPEPGRRLRCHAWLMGEIK